MNQFRRIAPILAVFSVLFLTLLPTPSSAKEVIKRFDSLVQVQKDGTFRVTETIVVRAEGRKIRRGIFRDFPLYFEGPDGHRKKVGFELVSVKRDDRPDTTRLEYLSDRVRIYIGKADVFLEPGTYTYIITYVTNRQMRYFENHDEIYWNATGNFWDFPIETVLAQIVLPEGAAAADYDAFTGRVGERGKDLTIGKIAGKRVVKYRTTRTLQPGEGLTVLTKVDKGFIDPPSSAMQSAWFWDDNRNFFIALAGLFLVVAYYFIAWLRVGIDPEKGTIVPRWDVPADMSPALVNYIHRKGLAGKGFDAISAALLNLAVKGLVTLENIKGGTFSSDTLVIEATGKSAETPLPVGEAALLRRIQGQGREFQVDSGNGEAVKRLQKSFASAMESEHRDKFYKHNTLAVIGGVVLSVAALGALVMFGNFSQEFTGALLSGGFTAAILSFFTFSMVRNFFAAGNLVGKIMTLVFSGFFAFSVLSGGLVFVFTQFDAVFSHANVVAIVVGIFVLNVLFYFLLGAPTPIGRKKMDDIEGLKTYLTLAEKDRMNMKGAPDFSTQHYEELLPYAVALGVEKPWSKAFEGWLAAAIASGAVAASYSPGWYRGSDFNSGSLSDTMGGFSESMQSGFSSAMPVPKSSSSGFGGGGGFSGGGGGGGGGGGW